MNCVGSLAKLAMEYGNALQWSLGWWLYLEGGRGTISSPARHRRCPWSEWKFAVRERVLYGSMYCVLCKLADSRDASIDEAEMVGGGGELKLRITHATLILSIRRRKTTVSLDSFKSCNF